MPDDNDIPWPREDYPEMDFSKRRFGGYGPDGDDLGYGLEYPFYRKIPRLDDEGVAKQYLELYSKDSLLCQPQPLVPDDRTIYHCTSLRAIDSIIRDGAIICAARLLKQNRLISGELLEDFGDSSLKFITPEILETFDLSFLPDDQVRKLKLAVGHAYFVFFERSPAIACDYKPKNGEPYGLIGLDTVVIGNYGFKLEDKNDSANKEGLAIRDYVNISFGFSKLVVPADRVAEYGQKIKDAYICQVSSLDKIAPLSGRG